MVPEWLAGWLEVEDKAACGLVTKLARSEVFTILSL
jgi:hypothetical protein